MYSTGYGPAIRVKRSVPCYSSSELKGQSRRTSCSRMRGLDLWMSKKVVEISLLHWSRLKRGLWARIKRRMRKFNKSIGGHVQRSTSEKRPYSYSLHLLFTWFKTNRVTLAGKQRYTILPNYVFLSLRKQKEDIFTYGSVRNSNVIYCSKTGRFSLIKGRRSYGYEKK